MSSMKDAKDVAAKPKEKNDFLYYMFSVQSLFILCNLKPEDEQNVKYIIMLMLILIAALFFVLFFLKFYSIIADEKWKLYDASNHQGRVHLVLLYKLSWNKSWFKH